MNPSSSNFSISKVALLLRYDWGVNKVLYGILLLASLAILILLYQVILYSNHRYLTMETGYVQGLFFAGFFILCMIWTGQSFWSLRSPRSSKSYLLLPASLLEKYFSELVIKVFGLIVIYPLVFWIGSNVGLGLFRLLGPLTFSSIQTEYIAFVTLTEIWIIEDFGNQLIVTKFIVVGLLVLIPSLMWVGSLIFGKFNLLGIPLILVITYLILTGTSLGLSALVSPLILNRDSKESSEMLKFDQPEILAETPLLILMSAIWIWMAVLLSYVVGYFKLSEKQV
ncbi:hypothetical protein SAMN04488104_100393 [Algoriphagus faecimaris]|uniref:ABC-2 family transporter protein n=1 Tax=Algoriphagus faecimaris TaxID=686796 RepID=A0A1G6NEF2_9BACT|nr:hypothetical protein [Algoriphagus faecimaris]SDC66168.1 hypothetical protein SAMN04488104_100393 [Algoriphagus faecimaris]